MIAEMNQNGYLVTFLIRIYIIASITRLDPTASIFTAPKDLNDEATLGFISRGMTLGYVLSLLYLGVETLVKVTAGF